MKEQPMSNIFLLYVNNYAYIYLIFFLKAFDKKHLRHRYTVIESSIKSLDLKSNLWAI